jgi:hypothetical protein
VKPTFSGRFFFFPRKRHLARITRGNRRHQPSVSSRKEGEGDPTTGLSTQAFAKIKNHGRTKEDRARIQTRATAEQPQDRQGWWIHHPRSDVLGRLFSAKRPASHQNSAQRNSGLIVIEKEKDRFIDSRFYSALQAFLRKALCGGIDDPPAFLSPGMPHITPISRSFHQGPLSSLLLPACSVNTISQPSGTSRLTPPLA